MSKFFKQSNNDNYSNGSLEFKEHREFFLKFFEIREGFTQVIANSSLTPTIDDVQKLYEFLFALIEWTTSYIIDIKSIDTELKKIEKNIYLVNTNKNKQLLKTIVTDLKDVFRKVSADHEKNELLPKLQIAEKEPWSDEKNSKKKVMYKTVMEMFRNV